VEGRGQIQASESLTRGEETQYTFDTIKGERQVGLELLKSATAGQRTQFYRSPSRNLSHYTAWSTSAPNLSSHNVLEIWFDMKYLVNLG